MNFGKADYPLKRPCSGASGMYAIQQRPIMGREPSGDVPKVVYPEYDQPVNIEVSGSPVCCTSP